MQFTAPFWCSGQVVCRSEVVLNVQVALVTPCPAPHLQSSPQEPADVRLDKQLKLEDGFCCCLQRGESGELGTWAAKHPQTPKNTLQGATGVESWPKKAARKSQPLECIHLSFLSFLTLNVFWPLMATGPDTVWLFLTQEHRYVYVYVCDALIPQYKQEHGTYFSCCCKVNSRPLLFNPPELCKCQDDIIHACFVIIMLNHFLLAGEPSGFCRCADF